MNASDLCKRVAITAAVATALGLSSPAIAQMQTENPGAPAGVLDAPAGTVLYDQTNFAAGNGAPDQDFEAAFDAYDSEGADDFVVTAADGWNIEVVNTIGTQSAGGSADSVDIRFLEDNGGSPGAEVAGCVYLGLVPVQAGGSFEITLPVACPLPAGTYWLAQQTNQSFGASGQHFWSNRSVQSGNESHWQNPLGGFGLGCTTWTPQKTCGVGGGVSPDFLFTLSGTEGAVVPDVARFAVSKDFDDNNDASVEVTLSCNTGIPLEQTTTIEEGDPVNFVIGDFTQGELNCTVTEAAVDGYTTSYDDGDGVSAVDCSWVDLFGGQYSCAIDNDLDQVQVVVTKEWVDENPGFNPFNVADAEWDCNNVAFGNDDGNLDFYTEGSTATDSFSVFPDWDTGTTCSITEVNLPDGGVEVDDSNCQNMTLFPGGGASCTIVNTRLYEGIPTLSQYGLAVLALLMLGMGFVGFRRFV